MKLCSSILLTATLLGPALAAPVQGENPGPGTEEAAGLLELLAELDREPRIAGTPGYDRALRILETSLEERGAETVRETAKSGRAIPHRSDVLLFEDGTQTAPFGGLREHWSPDAIPTMERPLAYDHNPEAADVRGPVVAVGAGEGADYERLLALGIEVEGSICMAEVSLIPGDRLLSVRELALLAAERGAIALLIAPKGDQGPGTAWVQENTLGEEPLPLPVAPVRGIERDGLLERLRAKRLRGADGKATTVRLGPGPVEAGVTIECPLVILEEVEVLVWQFRTPRMDPSAAPGFTESVSLLELPARPMGGSLEVAAEFLAITRGDHQAAFNLGWAEVDVAVLNGAPGPGRVVFGPFGVSERGSPLAPSAMESREPGAGLPPRAEVDPCSWPPVGRMGTPLWSDVFHRLDAAARLSGLSAAAQSLKGAQGPDSEPLPGLTRAMADCAAALRRPLRSLGGLTSVSPSDPSAQPTR